MDFGANKNLSRLFKAAVLGIALVSGAGCAAHRSWGVHNAVPTLDTALLTKGETALVKGIFGDAVDTSIITKYFRPSDWAATEGAPAETFDGKMVKFYGSDNYSADYSQEAAFNFGTFGHEMTHIWQRQTVPENERCNYPIYEYTPLDPKYHFDDYCDDQQASIIEDYVRRFLHPDHESRRLRNTPETDILLQKVVEDKFPEARETRLSYTAQEAAMKAQQKSKWLRAGSRDFTRAK